MIERFREMQVDLDRERKATMRLWAKREEQIRGVVEATAYGDPQVSLDAKLVGTRMEVQVNAPPSHAPPTATPPSWTALATERFRWAAPTALASGKHSIVFDFTYDGPGIAKGGTSVLKVDGIEAATLKIPRTIPFTMPLDESFDVGLEIRALASTTPTITHHSASRGRSTGYLSKSGAPNSPALINRSSSTHSPKRGTS